MKTLNKLRVERLPISSISSRLHNLPLPVKITKRIQLQACEIPGLEGDCWTWTGFTYRGYGRLKMKGFRTEKAHRIVYELLVGPIPTGLEIDHLCSNAGCVNPIHLEPVTRAENIRRSHTVGFGNGTRTHCRHGHQFTHRNVYLHRDSKGIERRFCRECGKRRNREWTEAHRVS